MLAIIFLCFATRKKIIRELQTKLDLAQNPPPPGTQLDLAFGFFTT